MEPKLHEVDTNGDTLLTLRNPNAPFLGLASATGPPLKRPGLEMAGDERQVQMRLSSQYLVRASKYFQRLMDGDWRETTAGGEHPYTVDTVDFDEEALLFLMNIIHGKTARLPLSVSLETLAKLSFLADYYQCPEAVQFFIKTWLQNMDERDATSRDALYGLCISWVFPDAKAFQSSTKTLIRKSKRPFDGLGLPISQRAIDALNKEREAHISAVVAALNELVKKESSSKGFTCSLACSSMYLGALIKSLVQLDLFDPVPPPPYAGHSLSSLEAMVRKIQQLPFKDFCPLKNMDKSLACRDLAKARSIVDGQFSKVQGLELKGFLDQP